MKKKLFVFLVVLLVAGAAFAGWKQAYDQGDELADTDAFLYVDVSDTTMATTGTTKYIEWSDIEDHLDTLYQGLDSDLTTYAGITPSANVQTLLGADDFAAFKTSLSLDSVENTALSTWAGTTNLDVGATAFADLTAGDSYTNFGDSDDDTINELFSAIDSSLSMEKLSGSTLTDSNLDLETTDAGKAQVLTITGLTANRSVTLPELTGSGRIYKVAILDGDDTYDVLLDPDGTDQIIGTSAAGDYLAADDAGDFIVIVDIADGYGLVSEKQGTWTEE